jgi:Raf kinase inhibitor-like YbhB/YbcL family protein
LKSVEAPVKIAVVAKGKLLSRMVPLIRVILLSAALLSVGCGGSKRENRTAARETEADMSTPTAVKIVLTSSAFKEGEMIPQKYTCDGSNISPPLKWDSIPAQAKSLALIADDPDAPMGTWVHWVIFNIPPGLSGLPENIPPKDSLPNGSLQGKNDFRNVGYGGPCPPGGTHRYFFKLYALDIMLELKPGCAKADLLEAIQGHIVAEGQLMGKYSH